MFQRSLTGVYTCVGTYPVQTITHPYIPLFIHTKIPHSVGFKQKTQKHLIPYGSWFSVLSVKQSYSYNCSSRIQLSSFKCFTKAQKYFSIYISCYYTFHYFTDGDFLRTFDALRYILLLQLYSRCPQPYFALAPLQCQYQKCIRKPSLYGPEIQTMIRKCTDASCTCPNKQQHCARCTGGFGSSHVNLYSEYKPLSDFGVVKGKAHMAVPGESKLIGHLERCRGHSWGTWILEIGHKMSATLTVFHQPAPIASCQEEP